MSAATPPPDPEIAVEQSALDQALASLGTMRQRAEKLLQDLIDAGSPDLDYVAALSRRVSLLADSPRPLLFGRIDEEEGPTWRIGRRHVEDSRSDPVVIDWRAPVAVPSYRASAKDALGLSRRRQIMVDRGSVMAVADDLFGEAGDQAGTTRLRGGDALLAELERARTGEMLYLVAPIQAEQDEIIRAPLNELVTVQGGPGTGKTAVGLHRAAYLLYNYPPLSRDGVLVLGPSRAFLRYIAQVLPSLGEEAVIQTTIADLGPRARMAGEDPDAVRRLKGDSRMAEILAAALRNRRGHVGEDVTLTARFASCVVPADELNELADSIAATPVPYKSGRVALRARLITLVRSRLRASGRFEANEPWLEGEVSARGAFRALLDQLWPSVSPTALVADLLTSESRLRAAADSLMSAPERALLLRPRGSRARPGWTAADLPPLDEADALVTGRSRSYGHIVVDEAQDLSPRQFRMLARRAPAGSLTVLGDLAQATGAWTYESWDEILHHLPTPAGVRMDELTLGYRAPGQVLELAAKLLPVAAPRVTPTRSIRPGRSGPHIVRTDPAVLFAESLREARWLADQGLLVGLVVAPGHLSGMAATADGRSDVGRLERDGIAEPITLVAAPAVKGLEFDA